MRQLSLPPHYFHLSIGGLWNHLLFEADRFRRDPDRRPLVLKRLNWLMDRLIQHGINLGQIQPINQPVES